MLPAIGPAALSRRACAFVVGLLIAVCLPGFVATAFAIDAPTGVAAAPASGPSIATITWNPVSGAALYRVWSSRAGLPYAEIGTTSGTTFGDTVGIPGEPYSYKVSAIDASNVESALSAAAGPVAASWVQSPHATYGATDLCGRCHSVHNAATYQNIFRDYGGTPGELSVCSACHDGSGATTNMTTAFSAPTARSGHTLESLVDTTTAGDLSNTCSGCHGPHQDSASRPKLYRSTVNGAAVTGVNNTWCLACHNDAQSWYTSGGATYPSLASPTRDATGYPTLGTYPGRTTYNDPARNAHINLPAASSPETRVAGDCLYCHASHRGPSAYDSLVATYGPSSATTVLEDRTNGTYAVVCFSCHGSTAFPGATNVLQFATFSGADNSQTSGHRVKSSGGLLPVNAPLPCYECHNPHGSTRGNATMIADTLGASLNTSETVAGAAGVRKFCLACHSTSDATPQGWDSGANAYATVTSGMTVVGLRRDGGTVGSGPDGGYNWLRLKAVSGHAVADTQSCYDCHMHDYAAGGYNVHRPGPGVSPGGIGCYACHSSYKTMDAADAGKTLTYHHVVGTSTGSYTGDAAPGPSGTYPTSSTDVYCVSCHADHDKFNTAKAANLRTTVTVAAAASVQTTATDFTISNNGGVCVSCHTLTLAKDVTSQLSSVNSATADPGTVTQVVSGTAYGASAHGARSAGVAYSVESSYGASAVFSANCAKCHNDALAKPFQSSANRFGVHNGTSRAILAALGATAVDPMGATFCYRCHSQANEFAGGKTANGKDWYGSSAIMAARAEYTYANFEGSMNSTHPVSSGRVECESCHNPHVTKTLVAATDPDNTLKSAAWASVADESAFCLKCHDGAAPVAQSTDTTYVPVSVTMAKPDMNKATYASRGHWSVNGSIDIVDAAPCLECHDSHGSKAPKLLGQYSGATKTNAIGGGAAITANNNTVCYSCHDLESTGFLSPSLTASGYPTDGTWPGQATYQTVYDAGTHAGSFHQYAAGVVWPGASYASGDCKNCHDVHGTANTLDELRTENAAGVENTYHFSPSDVGFCLNCHDGSPGGNVAQYFPTSAGGTAVQTATTRYGHKTKTAGTLPAGSAVPCYDCHNPHGSGSSYGLQVTSQINGARVVIGDAAGELDMSPTRTDASVRRFCFTCHTTADTGTGWNGASMVAIGAADRIEGILRTSTAGGAVLRLPVVSGHNAADAQSCYTCHGNTYGAATDNNVHNPSGGVSDGGVACYACHSSYQSSMEDGLGAKQGASRASSYHHVMGSAALDGDIAPFNVPGNYPTSQTDVYCVSCHTDHNYFNANKGANLRTDIALGGNVTTNTDFINSGTYGICVSCHAVSQAKQGMGTDQGALGAANTPVVAGATYGASAHRYAVASSFGASAFNGDCAKCHSDEQSKPFQTSTYRFGTHWSSSVGILRALGAFVGNPPQEEACYACHTAAGDKYATATMSAAAKATQSEFALTSKHDLAKVTCANCHNVHAATAGVPAADPDNTYSAASLTTTATVNTYCLKCHDGTPPAQSVNGTTYVPWGVSAAATANVNTWWAADGHGAAMLGAPFTGRASTRYAAVFTPTVGTWVSPSNSLGAPDTLVASSPTNNTFDGRQTFTFPSDMTAIDSASLTVRSRANGNWGGLTGGNTATQTIVYPTSTLSNGSWAIAGSAPAATRHESIDDPAGAPDDPVTYLNGTNTTEYQAGIVAPVIPANATNISVSIVWRGRDGTSNTNTVWSRIRYNAAWTSAATTNRNPTTAWTTYTDTWTTAPGGAAWTPANVALVTGLGIDASGTGPNWVTQMYIQVDYQVPARYDDTWSIQYSVNNGGSWTDLVPATTTAEGALMDHTVPLNGILTAANASQFVVRVVGAPVNLADNVGTIDWDSSTLSLAYSGTDPGPTKTDCRDCHEQHGSTLVHLLKTTVDGRAVSSYSDTADQAQCLACHRTGGMAASANVARFYPSTAGGEAAQTGTLPSNGTRFGHRTESAGTLPAGSALPCKACHNPHGSGSGGYGLVVTTMLNGAALTLGDGAGEFTMSDAGQKVASNVRNYCFACHTTSDTGKGYNGVTLAAAVAGDLLFGISRTGGHLKLPSYIGHRETDTTYSCYLCHGDDFTLSTSANVHNPTGGESRGGVPCYTCHSVYQNYMEDGLLTDLGPSRTTTYHHVMGSATQEGDTVTYPLAATAQTDVFCLSCHVDHNLFNTAVNAAFKRGSNLRTMIGATAPATSADTTNTDFIPGGAPAYGVCLSCHTAEQARDNVNQKAESTSTRTASMTGAAYDGSAHDFTAPSTFASDASAFRGNCVKCHDDESDNGGMERGTKTTGFQSSSVKFSTHYSAQRRILSAMGVTLTEPPHDENNCYRCHSLATDGLKTTANRDWYNQVTMDAASQGTYGLLTGAANTYKHNVAAYEGLHRTSPTDELQSYITANKHVECADCHDPHAAQATSHTLGGVNGNAIGTNSPLLGVPGQQFTPATTNWTTPVAANYAWTTGATKEYQICFKCHSSANANVTTWGGTGAAAWTDQALEFSNYNQSYHPVVAALPATDPGVNGSNQLVAGEMRTAGTAGGMAVGGFANGNTMYCSDCHAQGSTGSLGPHGSAVKWMLKGPNQAWPYLTSARNGTNDTTNYRTLSAKATNADTTNGVFCINCHVILANDYHDGKGEHAVVECVACHLRVPHGGKVSRLLAAQNAGSYPGNLPSRYSANGAGTMAPSGYISGITKTTGTYAESNCGWVDRSGGPSCANKHPAGNGNERW